MRNAIRAWAEDKTQEQIIDKLIEIAEEGSETRASLILVMRVYVEKYGENYWIDWKEMGNAAFDATCILDRQVPEWRKS